MTREAEFRRIVEKTLGAYITERGSFGVQCGILHFDWCGWMIAVDSTGKWEFATGQGFHGEGRSLEEAIQDESQK